MCIIDEIRREREDLARVLKRHAGIRKIVEDLYPDSAHFIYELLQNAEDAHATQARFTLTRKNLAFQHDGRPFERSDIEAITDIGEGTKANDDDKIGRFGVGFKAVFAYSETPHIWSPTFSFKISELVLPYRLDRQPTLGNETRFEFPFDNPKKNPETAFKEIRAGLSELAETTLLFLTHLESIRWEIDDAACGGVLRIKHSDYHYEIRKQSGEKTDSAHFLKFEKPVEGLDQQRIAVAFELDFLPKIEQYDRKKKLAKQMKIIPADPGRVAVFFPANKETSGLRFHLHAPFVPELSRASIKDTPTNQPLFEQLGLLTATSLHQIRNLGLLKVDLLAVLPNPDDDLPARYSSIRKLIIEAMRSESLTPTHANGHAPSRSLRQAKASLKELLAQEDLNFLVGCEEERYQWAIGATQKNSNVDRFLNGLEIKDWDIESFVELLIEKTNSFIEPDRKFMRWFSGKSPEWHQQLYALLYSEKPEVGLMSNKIVRLRNGKYGVGDNCFFPSDAAETDDVLPRVDRAVYSSGKNKTLQENARKFLEELGVREVDEAVQVEALLKQRYQNEDVSPKKKDLKRFIALVESEPQQAQMFEDYFIFKGEKDKWYRPADIYLDQPFMTTGLAAYYRALGMRANRHALAKDYGGFGVPIEAIAKFAEKVGAQVRLELRKVSCRDNPEWDDIRRDDVRKSSNDSYGRVDSDYDVLEFLLLVARPTQSSSHLIWTTMKNIDRQEFLEAKWKRNNLSKLRTSSSQLIHKLIDTDWIPQCHKNKTVFVRPAEAIRDLLPEGFVFDPGWRWLKAIKFGDDVTKKSEGQREKQELAQKAGFENAEAMEDALQFALLPAKERKRFLAELKRKPETSLPDHVPSDSVNRALRVEHQARKAPERESEQRTRLIAIGKDEVKEKSEQYLEEQYTNPDGVMICQVCRTALPFKLDDGANYYFEKIEFLVELEKRHYQNYLALCPNHAAMFQHANGSRDELRALFDAIEGNSIEIVLAQSDKSIYFTKTHIADLRAVLNVEPKRKKAGHSQ